MTTPGAPDDSPPAPVSGAGTQPSTEEPTPDGSKQDGASDSSVSNLETLVDLDSQPLSRWAQRSELLRADATERFDAAIERFPVLGTLVVAAQRETASGGGLLAGGLAYRLFFWLVPLGLLAATISSFFTTAREIGLEEAARKDGLGAVAADAAAAAIKETTTAHWYLLGIGIVLTIWAGIKVVRALNIVFALAWGQAPPKLKLPIVASIAFTIIASSLSATAGAAGAAVGYIGLGPLATILAVVMIYTFAALGISWFFPHGDAPPRALIPGALLISIGGLVLHVAVTVYLAPKLGRSMERFGILGAASVVLAWLYILTRLVTVSAFVNATLWMREQGEIEGPTPRSLLKAAADTLRTE